MVTAFDKSDAISLSQSAGIDGYLEKPVDASLLLDAMMDALKLDSSNRDYQSAHKGLLDLSNSNILLVEDNALNQQVVLGFLEETHANIDVAENGKIALNKLANQTYDLVFMDLQMPEMDGITATSEIRKQANFKDLPIIAMTAHAMQDELQKCLDVGMNDYFTKPIDPNALLTLLSKWLTNGSSKQSNSKTFEKVLNTASTNDDDDVVENTFLSELAKLPILDVQGAIKAMGGREHIYQQLVIDFTKTYAETVDSLREIYHKGEFEEAFRIAHSLKSNANYIGAFTLTKRATELESKLKNSPESADLIMASTCIELNNVLIALATVKEHEPTSQNNNNGKLEESPIYNVEYYSGQLTILLNSISNLVEQENAEAEDLLPRLLKLTINTEHQSLAQKIAECIEDIEYDEAMKIIKTLMNEL